MRSTIDPNRILIPDKQTPRELELQPDTASYHNTCQRRAPLLSVNTSFQAGKKYFGIYFADFSFGPVHDRRQSPKMLMYRLSLFSQKTSSALTIAHLLTINMLICGSWAKRVCFL
jgi:hypothetical protein